MCSGKYSVHFHIISHRRKEDYLESRHKCYENIILKIHISMSHIENGFGSWWIKKSIRFNLIFISISLICLFMGYRVNARVINPFIVVPIFAYIILINAVYFMTIPFITFVEMRYNLSIKKYRLLIFDLMILAAIFISILLIFITIYYGQGSRHLPSSFN